MLYISVGDAAISSNAQDLANPHGKILRIDPHGSLPGAHGVPASNPFAGVAGAVGEIWSLGLRNPWRFSFDRLTGDMVIGDVGNSAFEEVDYAPASGGLGAGANFGWPGCEGFSGSCPGTTAPVFAYPHNDGPDSVIGGYVYRGSQIPELAGRYVYADLGDGELRSIRLGTPLASDDRSEGAPPLELPTSFGEDATCGLYVTTTGSVSKIVGSRSDLAPGCVPVAKKCKKSKKKKKKSRAVEAKKRKHKKKRCKKKKHKKTNRK
jgi:glucose/arabinose dehydrogenase